MHSGRIIDFDVQIEMSKKVFKKFYNIIFQHDHMVPEMLQWLVSESRGLLTLGSNIIYQKMPKEPRIQL